MHNTLKKNETFMMTDDQTCLISECLDTDMPLSNKLNTLGLKYNDLRYLNSYTKKWTGRKAASLNDFEKVADGIPFVSLFTGCGGIDLGLEALGFSHVAGFEIHELFCKTLRANRPNWKIFGPPTHSGDISNFEDCEPALSQMITTPFEGVFIGGPPCQPFSIAANQRFSKKGENFKRTGFDNKSKGNLLFDYLSLILRFRPKVFVIENVPGLRDIDSGSQLNEAVRIMEKAGYTVEKPKVLNASDYSIPQNRKRLFVVGHRTKHLWQWPEKHEKKVGCGSVLRNQFVDANNAETRQHNAGSIKRYMMLDYGKRDQLGRVDRLDPTLPSKTVIAGGINGGGRSHLHPEVPRTLSVRECARLQTFPDNYIFKGPTARQFTQVGNAVPPVLAAEIGIKLNEFFKLQN